MIVENIPLNTFVRNVIFVGKNSKMIWYMKKHLQTKHNIFFGFQVGDIKISDKFYKIQKFLRTSWAPIITTNGINFLMAGPLTKSSFS